MKRKNQWHPAFCGAAELEFKENRADLDFNTELNLSKKPLQMDLLIIEKRTDVVLKNEIGTIFKKYNVIEYKGPGDGINIDKYYKVIAYACLYKSLGHHVDEIPAEEITISLVQESYPRKFIERLQEQGSQVINTAPGIYHVHGNVMFTTQIIVIKYLSNEHAWLRAMTNRIQKEDAYRFLEIAQHLTAQGDRNNADAIMQVSVAANQSIYELIREEDSYMCEALRELMKDDLDRALSQGAIQGSIEAWQEDEIPQDTILARLQKKYNLDAETAAEYFEKFSTEAVV